MAAKAEEPPPPLAHVDDTSVDDPSGDGQVAKAYANVRPAPRPRKLSKHRCASRGTSPDEQHVWSQRMFFVLATPLPDQSIVTNL
jgi:hypothetical protein